MLAKVNARENRCSFCGRSRNEVNELVAGAPQASRGVPRQMVGKSAFICDECVLRCKNIMTASEHTGRPVTNP
jgi:ATP-dependent protease Clp ATPase subunit